MSFGDRFGADEKHDNISGLCAGRRGEANLEIK